MNTTLPQQLLLPLLFIACHLWHSANSQETTDTLNCGYLDHQSYGSFQQITGLQEHPWIARVGYESSRGIVYRCLAVLITDQYLLSPAKCFDEWHLQQTPVRYVLLGDWNPKNPFMQPDCDAKQNCNPEPQLLEIDEIIIHPEYKSRTLMNNISLLKLKQPISFSSHIRPVCLPPWHDNSPSTDFVGQYLTFAGFGLNSRPAHKVKGLALVQGHGQCRNAFVSYNYLEAAQAFRLNHICGKSNLNVTLMTGSPLMGVHVWEKEPQSYYLVGLLLYAPSPSNSQVFIMVQPYRKWIVRNIQNGLTDGRETVPTISTRTTKLPEIFPASLVRHEQHIILK